MLNIIISVHSQEKIFYIKIYIDINIYNYLQNMSRYVHISGKKFFIYKDTYKYI